MFKGKQNILVEINDEKITTQEFIAFVQKINLSSKEIERVGKDRIFDEILANYISEKIIAKEAKQKGILLNDKFYIQSGAGIVADSVPEKEYIETVNKAKALISSLN